MNEGRKRRTERDTAGVKVHVDKVCLEQLERRETERNELNLL